MSTPAGNESDKPGGDLTDHGADPAAREAETTEGTTSTSGTSTTAGEEIPAGDLTDHGVDPDSRG